MELIGDNNDPIYNDAILSRKRQTPTSRNWWPLTFAQHSTHIKQRLNFSNNVKHTVESLMHACLRLSVNGRELIVDELSVINKGDCHSRQVEDASAIAINSITTSNVVLANKKSNSQLTRIKLDAS